MDKHFTDFTKAQKETFKEPRTFSKAPTAAPTATFDKAPTGTFDKAPSGGVSPAGAHPKPPPKKHPPTKKAGQSRPANKLTPKKKSGKQRPPNKNKTAGKAKQKCVKKKKPFNFKESIAKNVASGILEKRAHSAAHKNEKKVNKQNRVLRKNLKEVARGKGPYSQIARGMIKDSKNKVATAAKVTKGVRWGGGGVAGAVIETGYQIHKTGGKLNRNAAVEIGAAGAVGVATTGIMAVGAAAATVTGVAATAAALPAVVVGGAVFATSVAVGVALDYSLEQTGVKDKIKDRMGVPLGDRD